MNVLYKPPLSRRIVSGVNKIILFSLKYLIVNNDRLESLSLFFFERINCIVDIV